MISLETAREIEKATRPPMLGVSGLVNIDDLLNAKPGGLVRMHDPHDPIRIVTPGTYEVAECFVDFEHPEEGRHNES